MPTITFQEYLVSTRFRAFWMTDFLRSASLHILRTASAKSSARSVTSRCSPTLSPRFPKTMIGIRTKVDQSIPRHNEMNENLSKKLKDLESQVRRMKGLEIMTATVNQLSKDS